MTVESNQKTNGAAELVREGGKIPWKDWRGSSVKSPGFVGFVNRALTRIAGEEDADIVAFLTGEPKDFEVN